MPKSHNDIIIKSALRVLFFILIFMEELANDSEKSTIHKVKAKMGFFFKTVLFLGVSVFALFIFIFVNAMTDKTHKSFFDLSHIPVVGQITNFAASATKQLKGEERDRINVLFLGIGGKNHDGGLLTDTMMLISAKPSVKKVSMVSIPRDMTVPIEGYGWRKVNSVNALAERQEPGSGGLATSQTVSKVLDTPIDYYVTVDFDGFMKIIDDIGGIEVDVENTFDDYAYPIRGREDAYPYASRFEHLHVEKGLQQMDSELALKYARSRHAYGVEGSDFSRAKRQQKVIEAVKSKMMSSYLLLRPQKISSIISDLADHLETNLSVWEVLRLWDMFKDVKKEDIINKVLDNGPDGFLVNAVGLDGAYILTPASGSFTEIQYFVNNIFGTVPTAEKDKVTQEASTVEVLNGTWIGGLATQAATDIEKYGFDITYIGNSGQKDFQKSMIYDLTFGAKKESLAALQSKTDADVSTEMPAWLITNLSNRAVGKKIAKPDFILILGQNADKTHSGAVNKESATEIKQSN